jgi:hypothetical protein
MITVIWSCPVCHLRGIREKVENRRPEADITEWVEAVAQQCGNQHDSLNPTCENDSIDLAIPMPENEGDGIGVSGKTFMFGWQPESGKPLYEPPPQDIPKPMAAPRIRPPRPSEGVN